MQQEIIKVILMHKSTLAYVVIKQYLNIIQVTIKQVNEQKEYTQKFQVHDEFFNVEKLTDFYVNNDYKIMSAENFDIKEFQKKYKINWS